MEASASRRDRGADIPKEPRAGEHHVGTRLLCCGRRDIIDMRAVSDDACICTYRTNGIYDMWLPGQVDDHNVDVVRARRRVGEKLRVGERGANLRLVHEVAAEDDDAH